MVGREEQGEELVGSLVVVGEAGGRRTSEY